MCRRDELNASHGVDKKEMIDRSAFAGDKSNIFICGEKAGLHVWWKLEFHHVYR